MNLANSEQFRPTPEPGLTASEQSEIRARTLFADRPHRFTADEWRTLIEAPIFVAAGVAFAGSFGKFRAYREWVAFVRAIRTPDEAFADSPLVRSVCAGLHARETSSKPHHPIFNVGPDTDGTEGRAAALAACRDVVGLLADVPADEADTFKRWLVAVSEAVASAAKAGGFLGFGGRRTRPEEQAMVRVIADALGVADPA
jgi:hypothetical protein